MPVDSKEALERASLVRSDPSLDGVSRKNTSKVDGEYNWQYYSPGGDVVDDEEPINRWNSLAFLLLGRRCGFVPMLEVTYKQQAEMSKEDYSIGIIQTGQKSQQK